jgi:hypothetical protein
MRFAVFVAALLAVTEASAQEPSVVDRAAAEALFREAKVLMAEGRWAEACPKLAESQRRAPAGGTLLNLAICHENEGRLATAWVELHDALAMARRDERDDRIEVAEEHLKAVEARLPRLFVTVAPELGAVEVKVDGAVIGAEAWSTGVPLDPGTHELAVSAPGRAPWATAVAATEAGRHTVEVEAEMLPIVVVPEPPPVVAPPPPPAPFVVPPPFVPPPEEPTDPGETQRIAGWSLVGVGGAAILAGAIAGGIAIAKDGASDDACPDERCTQEGLRLNDQAEAAALAADVGFIAGAGLAAVGLIVALTAPSADTNALLLRF